MPPSTRPAPAANRLIETLPHKHRQRFLAGCEPVQLAYGEVLAEPGERSGPSAQSARDPDRRQGSACAALADARFLTSGLPTTCHGA